MDPPYFEINGILDENRRIIDEKMTKTPKTRRFPHEMAIFDQNRLDLLIFDRI
jgi:hypothetical protein